MKNPIDNYWNLKLNSVKENLEKNKFKVFIAQDAADAKKIALEEVIPPLNVKSVSWGGSMSFVATGLFHDLSGREDLEVLNTFDKTLSQEDSMELRRRSLMVDLFVTGTNAITEAGHLVNLDMIGNRVAAMMWGTETCPFELSVAIKFAVISMMPCSGLKIMPAPVNTMNLDKKTPCRHHWRVP